LYKYLIQDIVDSILHGLDIIESFARFVDLSGIKGPMRLVAKTKGLDIGQTSGLRGHLVHFHGIRFAFGFTLFLGFILALIKPIVGRKLVHYNAVILALSRGMELGGALLQEAGKHGLIPSIHAGGEVEVVLFGDVQIQ